MSVTPSNVKIPARPPPQTSRPAQTCRTQHACTTPPALTDSPTAFLPFFTLFLYLQRLQNVKHLSNGFNPFRQYLRAFFDAPSFAASHTNTFLYIYNTPGESTGIPHIPYSYTHPTHTCAISHHPGSLHDTAAPQTTRSTPQQEESFSFQGILFWPNRDPIGEVGGFNVYGFVGNNPIIQYDHDGRFFNLAGGILSVGLGYGIAWATGEEYSWQEGLIDFAMGSAGPGLATKVFRAARLCKRLRVSTRATRILVQSQRHVTDYNTATIIGTEIARSTNAAFSISVQLENEIRSIVFVTGWQTVKRFVKQELNEMTDITVEHYEHFYDTPGDGSFELGVDAYKQEISFGSGNSIKNEINRFSERTSFSPESSNLPPDLRNHNSIPLK